MRKTGIPWRQLPPASDGFITADGIGARELPTAGAGHSLRACALAACAARLLRGSGRWDGTLRSERHAALPCAACCLQTALLTCVSAAPLLRGNACCAITRTPLRVLAAAAARFNCWLRRVLF